VREEEDYPLDSDFKAGDPRLLGAPAVVLRAKEGRPIARRESTSTEKIDGVHYEHIHRLHKRPVTRGGLQSHEHALGGLGCETSRQMLLHVSVSTQQRWP
jgi:hypothetical protein